MVLSNKELYTEHHPIKELDEVVMNITVLGANGAIGQTIVEEAVQAGHQVLAVARREGALDNSPSWKNAMDSLPMKPLCNPLWQAPI